MVKIKDKPAVERPRERLLKKGPDALSKSDLLAVLLGSGIKGKNVQQLSQHIIRKFGDNFLNITAADLQAISGIGQAKALQIVAAISLVKRFFKPCEDEIQIINSQDVLNVTSEFRNKKKEHLISLYLNARNGLIKKETISVGILDKTLLHPREIFSPAIESNAASLILVHNHPTGDYAPSERDNVIIKKLIEAGQIMGIPVIDFVIISSKGCFSFFNSSNKVKTLDYIAEGELRTLWDLLEEDKISYTKSFTVASHHHFKSEEPPDGHFSLQNRRYLGNKYRLLGFIEDIIAEKCGPVETFCDIFAGTGVVGERFNDREIAIISNDLLYSNYICLHAFLGVCSDVYIDVQNKIELLNNIEPKEENYFSENFGGTYFSNENARKIGAIREHIEVISSDSDEKNILLCSLLYAADKVANTVGHYDAFRKKLDMLKPIRLQIPHIQYWNNQNNEVYNEDANELIKKIYCDVLYLDPPYNSRQYSDAYHLLENLAEWSMPAVTGLARKMDRKHIKSDYCQKNATSAFANLIYNAKCKHILLSYNNTGETKDGRSNARIDDKDIMQILSERGSVEVFEKDYKAFTAGKSNDENNAERIFYCKIRG
ncbi:Modification methylase FokI [Limihaloglobus sulfuriphilus]|uniref:site-specific DNA-methyltransferase (adenine-specific) n=1 Tax=Limihaloglobus sulfuriphilus TaxID=1851148 RepID=A0A1Q2MAK1_9BACT|nr:DNA repair protein RadC [Limihaloglobus sulfuriphilus]AQQ69753.1 Modification methylase FokI [Limihaloglobus sulfuriphilus]